MSGGIEEFPGFSNSKQVTARYPCTISFLGFWVPVTRPGVIKSGESPSDRCLFLPLFWLGGSPAKIDKADKNRVPLL